MPPKGYSNQYLVADALGTHDGVVPVLMLQTVLEAAEQWIDARTQRSWGISSVTDEQQTFDASVNQHGPVYPLNPLRWTPNNGWADPVVHLRTFPAVSVSAVRARYLSLGATTYTLNVADYELVDASKGWLLVSTNWVGYRLGIDYTVSVPVPSAITLAATQLVAAWVQPMLTQTDTKALSGVKSYTIGQDLSVTFQDSSKLASTLGVPASVTELIEAYRVHSFVV